MKMSNSSQATLLMALAMSVFTFNDAITKAVVLNMGIGQLIAIRGGVSLLFLLCMAKTVGTKIRVGPLLRPLVLVRTAFELGATVFYIFALGAIDLATATSIMQAIPLAATLGAAVFLGERVGWRRWLAIAVGFFGVLLIVKPGPEGLTTSSLAVLASMACATARDLVTRRLAKDNVPTVSITLFTSFGNAVLGLILVTLYEEWQPVDNDVVLLLAVASVLVLIGNQALIFATRAGDISLISPIRYLSLIWAIMIGAFVFGELPDGSMLAGTSIVIVSGLYTFGRERRSRNKQLTRSPP